MKGQVIDSTHNQLRGAIIKIDNTKGTSFGISNSVGEFVISRCDTLSFIKVSISYIGFASFDTTINTKATEVDLGTIILISKVTLLNDVLVVRKPIEIRGDTTIFNINSYKSKIDVNIEDVIKKLPGFDVDPNGAIRYNNKPIEDILIEGDALSKNYKLLSKNITPDIVDKLEVIDKYNKNPVLKNIVNSDGQVINLTLKAGSKSLPIGQAKAGIGIKNRYSTQLNMILLRKKFKSIGIVNANNTGVSPYEEITFDNSFDQEKKYELNNIQNPNFIQQTQLFNRNPLLVSSNRTLFNKSILISEGLIFKLHPNQNLSLFTDFYSDNVNKYQNNTFTNNLNNVISFKEAFIKQIKPLQFNNQLTYTLNTKSSRLLVVGKYRLNNQQEKQNVFTNLEYTSQLKSRLSEFGAAMFYTLKLDSNHALDFSGLWHANRQSQTFEVASSGYRLIDNYFTNQQSQSLGFNQAPINLKAFYYSKQNKNFSSTMFLEASGNRIKYNSGLKLNDSISGWMSPLSYINNRRLTNQQLKAGYSIDASSNFVNVSATLKLVLNRQQFYTQNLIDTSTIFKGILPAFIISRKIKKFGNISLQLSYENNPPEYNMISRFRVLNSYRSLVEDSNLINQVNGKTMSLTYYNRNLEKASFFVLSYQYFDKLQNRIPIVESKQSLDYYKYFYANQVFRFNNLYAKYDKYLKPFRTTLTLKNTTSFFSNPQYFNGIEASSNMFTNTSGINIRPSFIKNVNLTVGSDYYFQKELLSQKRNYQFKYMIEGSISVNTKLSLGGNLRQVFSDFFPNKKSLFFSDFYAWYTIKPQKIELKFSLINGTNTRQVIYGERNVGYERNNVEALLPRFALIEFSTRF